MRPVCVLGTGTAVGKTHVSEALARAVAQRDPGLPILCVKPLETGLELPADRAMPNRDPVPGTDAARLDGVTFHVKHLRPHPLFAFEPPVSPHLAARRAGIELDPKRIAGQVREHFARACASGPALLVVETAGGVFSPLSPSTTNLDLARALEPAFWLLVAPDALGVLHDVRATLHAMRASAREPDALALSAARPPDASTGTNAHELPRVGLPAPLATVPPGGEPDLTPLVDAVLGS